MDEEMRKKLQQKSVSNIVQKLSDQLNNRLSSSPVGNLVKGVAQGAVNTFRPYGNLLGEAAYQGSRFINEPAYRRSVTGQAPQAGDIESLSQKKDVRFMSPDQLNSRANIIVSGSAATGKAMLGTYGLANPASALANAGISGAVDYGLSRLSGKSNNEALNSAGRAAGGSTVYAGIGKLTSPLQTAAANKLLPIGANFIKRGLVKGGVSAAANVGESAVFTPLTEGRFASPQELITAAAIGLGSGVIGEASTSALNKVRGAVKKAHPKASVEEVEKITKEFIRDEAGRFATQGARKKEVRYASDIRQELGLPKYGDYDVPVGFQAKPLSKKQSLDLKDSAYEELISQGLSSEEINTKYPKVAQEYIQNQPQKLNVKKLSVNDPQRAEIRSLETDEPRVVLKNGEVVKASDLTTGSKSAVTIEQTKKKLAEQLNSRQAVVSLEKEFTDLKTSGAKPEVLQAKMEEIANQGKIARSQGTDAARTLQARNILADQLATPMQKVFRLLDNAGIDQKNYTKDAANVDWDNAEQVVNFYRRYVPPTKSDWLDTLRYNSMLSSPNTHINNAFSNLVGSSVVAPVEKTLTGGIDFLRSAVTGSDRQHFAGEGPAYLKGYVSSAGDAATNFLKTIRGQSAIKNLDFGSDNYMPLGTEGKAGSLIYNYTFPTRALEAVDQFFTTLVKGGERAALKVKQSNGVKINDIESEATRKAAYRLFRGELNDKNQGAILNAIDEFTGLVQQARSSDKIIVSGLAKFTLPFVKTPMNILKQGIEYSPAGLATMVGAKNKTEQFSKALLGTAGMMTTAMLAVNGSLSFSEPTDQKKKQAYRDAGIQPYSIKVGDKWISYQKLPPQLSFPIAIVAALHDAQENKTIDENTFNVVMNTIAKTGKFYSDQSYVKNIGDLVASLQGDPERFTSFVGNYPQQLVPWRAFLGWATRLTDPYQRQIDPKAGIIERQTQQLMMTLPGLSGNVPTRNNEFGEPIKAQNQLLNAFSPLKVSTENPEKREYYDMLKEKSIFDKNIVQAAEDPNQALGVSKDQLITDRKNKAMEDLTKSKVEITGQATESNGKLFYYEEGDVKTVELNRQIKTPSFTGKTLIDTMRLKTFADDIGKRITDVSKLVDLGRIDEREGYDEIIRLDAQRTAALKIKSQMIAASKPKARRKLTIRPRSRSRSFIPKQRKQRAFKI